MKVQWIPTDKATFNAVFHTHRQDFGVFSSFTSQGDGDPLSAEPCSMTEWGFKDADVPLIKYERSGIKDNKTTEYWIALITEDSDE